MRTFGSIVMFLCLASAAQAKTFELAGDKRVDVFASAGMWQGAGNGSTEKIVEPIRVGIGVNLLPATTRTWLSHLAVYVAAGCSMSDVNLASAGAHLTNLSLSASGCGFSGSTGLNLSIYEQKFLHIGIYGEYFGTFGVSNSANLSSLSADGVDLSAAAGPRTQAGNRWNMGNFTLVVAVPVPLGHRVRISPYIDAGYNLFYSTAVLKFDQDLSDYLSCDHAALSNNLGIEKHRPMGEAGFRLDVYDFTAEVTGTYVRSFIGDDYAWAVNGHVAYHFGK